MSRFTTLATIVLMTLTGSLLAWAAKEGSARPGGAGANADQAAPQVGEPRVRTYPAVTYFSTSGETTLAGLPDHIPQAMPAVEKAVEEARGRIVGPPIFVYHGARQDPQAKFTVEIGFPVAEGATAPASGRFKVKKLPAFRCVSLLYMGPISGLSGAYEKLAANTPGGAGGAAAARADESRQMMLYWEGEDSPNNVLQVMVALPRGDPWDAHPAEVARPLAASAGTYACVRCAAGAGRVRW